MSLTAVLPNAVLSVVAKNLLPCPGCENGLPAVEFSDFERCIGGSEETCPSCERLVWVPTGTARPRLATIPFWLFAVMNGNLLPFLAALAKMPKIVIYDLRCGLVDCRAPIRNMPIFAPRNGEDAIFSCANFHPNWVQFIDPAPQAAVVPVRMMELVRYYTHHADHEHSFSYEFR